MFTNSEILVIIDALDHSKHKISAHRLDTSSIPDDDDLEVITDACEEYLLFCGFDSNYNLNSIGIRLNAVIDKIFDYRK